MQGYVNQSIPQHPQLRKAERMMEERGDSRVQIYKSTRGLSRHDQSELEAAWNFPLNPMPRPGGRATRVIYTEYDLPRETIEPHDVIVDKDGIAWYSSFGEQNLGRLDPKTGKVTEYPVPEHKPGFPTGFLALRTDQRRQSVARQHVPGHARQVRSARPRSSTTGRCRRSRTSTPRRSTW